MWIAWTNKARLLYIYLPVRPSRDGNHSLRRPRNVALIDQFRSTPRQQLAHIRTRQRIRRRPRKWIAIPPLLLQHRRVAAVRVRLEGPGGVLQLSPLRFLQIKSRRLGRVDAQIGEAIDRPPQGVGMHLLEPPLLEREGHHGNLVGIPSGDLSEATDGKHEILEGVGGKLFGCSAGPHVGRRAILLPLVRILVWIRLSSPSLRPQIESIGHPKVTHAFVDRTGLTTRFPAAKYQQGLGITGRHLDAGADVRHDGLGQALADLVVQQVPNVLVGLGVLEVARHDDGMAGHDDEMTGVGGGHLMVEGQRLRGDPLVRVGPAPEAEGSDERAAIGAGGRKGQVDQEQAGGQGGKRCNDPGGDEFPQHV